MRRSLIALSLLGAFAVPQPTRASCVGPSVGATPNVRRAGELVLLTAENWTTVCNDTGGSCGGCGDCSPPDEVDDNGIERVVVELMRPGMAPVALRTFETAETTTFVEEVRLPPDLEPGRYRIRASGLPRGPHANDRLTIVR